MELFGATNNVRDELVLLFPQYHVIPRLEIDFTSKLEPSDFVNFDHGKLHTKSKGYIFECKELP